MATLSNQIIIESELEPFQVANYDDKVIKGLKKKGLIVKTSGKDGSWYHFVVTGLVIIDENVIVSLPKTYNFSGDEKSAITDVKLLYHVLLKSNSKLHVDQQEDLNESLIIQEGNRLTTIDFLINDFLENGLYYNEIKKTSNISSSKIIWNATIKTKNPIISNNNVIYNDFVYERNLKDLKTETMKYHAIALKIIVNRFGWLYNLESSNFKSLNVDINYDIDVVKISLERELRSINNIRKIKVVKSILEILIGFEKNSLMNENSFLFTRTFHIIWEGMCGEVFKNDFKKLNRLVPKPKWTLEDGSTKKVSQIPDIILIDENVLYIVDAKYYDVCRNMPGWHDLVKQFFYAYTVEKYLPISIENAPYHIKEKLQKINKVKNIFLFPTFEDIIIKKHGKVDIQDISSLGTINSYLLNCRFLMENYVKGRRYDLSTLLN